MDSREIANASSLCRCGAAAEPPGLERRASGEERDEMVTDEDSDSRVVECELTNFFKILLNESDGQNLPTTFVIHVAPLTRRKHDTDQHLDLLGESEGGEGIIESGEMLGPEVIVNENGFAPPPFDHGDVYHHKGEDEGGNGQPDGKQQQQQQSSYSSDEQERKKKRLQTQYLFAPSSNRPHCCAECGETFKRRNDYLKHLEEYAAERYHACIERQPPPPPTPPPPPPPLPRARPVTDRPFVCGDCGKSFRIRSNLVQHIQIHTTSKAFSCEMCGKAFKTKSNLAQHSLIHTTERTHFCMQCGKVFKTKSNLRQHLSIHTDEKPFSCVQCGKTFKTKSNLAQHYLIHNSERTHACMHCQKVFKTKSNLAQHLLVHTNERTHACGHCGKAFKTKSNLAQHYRCHVNDPPNLVC